MRILWEGFGFGWGEVAYSGVTFPLVEPALEHITQAWLQTHHRFPLFSLFTGVLVSRIYMAADAVGGQTPRHVEFLKAPYLNDHPAVSRNLRRTHRADHLRRHRHELPDVQIPHTGSGLRGGSGCRAGKPPSSRRRHERHRLQVLRCRRQLHRPLPGWTVQAGVKARGTWAAIITMAMSMPTVTIKITTIATLMRSTPMPTTRWVR